MRGRVSNPGYVLTLYVFFVFVGILDNTMQEFKIDTPESAGLCVQRRVSKHHLGQGVEGPEEKRQI